MSGSPTYRASWGDDRLVPVVGESVFSEVYASHVLEHVLWTKTAAALLDVFEILQPGGLFEVWVPNFQYLVQCYLAGRCGDNWRRHNPEADPMLWLNGRIFTYGPGPDNLHHACFDEPYLARCLKQAGFVSVRRLAERKRGASHGPIDLGMQATKPQ